MLQLVGRLQNDDYRVVSSLIQLADPIPSFDKACSMLELDRVNRETKSQQTPTNTVLLTTPSSNPTPSSNSQTQKTPIQQL